jgi:hypothetical protein
VRLNLKIGDIMNADHKRFLYELRELLGRYNAELTAEDHWGGYAECGKDVRITVDFHDYRTPDLDLGDSFTSTFTNGRLDG